VFRNITNAFISSSGRIDGHTLSVMVQGAISPTKLFTLEGNGRVIKIDLPDGAAEYEKNTYLVPSTKFLGYIKFLEEKKGYTVDRLGSFVSVQSEGERFHISVIPYIGSYKKLRYSVPR
jgi:hypothetical protein